MSRIKCKCRAASKNKGFDNYTLKLQKPPL